MKKKIPDTLAQTPSPSSSPELDEESPATSLNNGYGPLERHGEAEGRVRDVASPNGSSSIVLMACGLA